MKLIIVFLVAYLISEDGLHAMSLIGSDHYYKVLSVGANERLAGRKNGNRDLTYLRSDYNPYSIQEVKTSITVSCYVEAKHIDGKVFTATCPAGCDAFADHLWGSGVYTEDSCFCAAALHDGLITEKGGAVTIRKIEGKSSYSGTTRNGVTSKSHGRSEHSFIFQNAGKARRPSYEVSCIVQANWIRETDFNVICPAGCGVVTDLLWGDNSYADNSYICAAAVHAGVVEDSTGGEVRVVKTGVQNGFTGITKHDVTSSYSREGQEAFELEKIREKSSSVLEVSCYFRADHVEEEVFTARCPPGCDAVSDQVYGTGIYTQDSFLCGSAIHAGRMQAPLGGVVTVFKTSGNINFIGSYQNDVSSKDSEYVATSFIFQDSTIRQPKVVTVACGLRGDHLRDDVATIVCPSNCDHEAYEVWGTDTYKSDSHICASAAHAGIIDVSLGGAVTVKRLPGLQSYETNTRQRIISQSFGASPTAFSFADNIQNVESILAGNCTFTAELISDSMFSLMCPPGCSAGGSKIWGDGVYTSDSPLCAAAIHSGFFKGSLGGKITVHKVNGRAKYSGALRNGIQSFSYGSWSRSSVVFQRPCIEVEPVYQVTCETRANFMVDDTFIATCPPGCDSDEDEVWGTGVYTDDSHVCGAAIHDGRINADVGGQITVGKVPGLLSYAGSAQNTIQSKTQGKWRKSIIFQDAVLQHTSTFTVTCDVEANMILDEEYSVICPPGCDEETERVWGTDIYTEDSYICAAAIHASKIDAGTGGHVTVVAMEETTFVSTTRNGITSKPYDKTTRAWKFI